jgi:hypothetical protein
VDCSINKHKEQNQCLFERGTKIEMRDEGWWEEKKDIALQHKQLILVLLGCDRS